MKGFTQSKLPDTSDTSTKTDGADSTETTLSPVMASTNTLTRRQAIVAALATCMTFEPRIVRADVPPGVLTIDLNRFRVVRVTLGKQTVDISSAEVFRALKETT